ncbi:MAG: aminotransferase class IV [Gemmatimonadales bacterium]|nr:aminotransferase class IV [Gemmatimonadales bacterium]
MIVYLNGQFLDSDQATVSIWDGGYLYGDGIFTTLRLYCGVPLDLPAHWGRLREQARALELPLPLEFPELENAIASLAARSGRRQADGRIRITISRGGSMENPLPLRDLEKIPPTILITLAPLPEDLPDLQSRGIPVITLGAFFSRGNVPELKTLNTLPSILAQRMAAAAGCPEAILTGPEGILLEGAASNLFLVSSGNLLTPATGAGFLAGLTREKVLNLAKEMGIEVRQKKLDGRHLEAACEVFVVGSVREVVPVVTVDGRTVGDGTPGPVTRKFQHEYRQMIAGLLGN